MTDQGENNENRGELPASGSQLETVVRPPVFPAAEYARFLFKRHDMTKTVTPLSQKILSRYKTSQRAVHGKTTDLPLVQAKQSWGFEHVSGSNPGTVENQGALPESVRPAAQVVQAKAVEPVIANQGQGPVKRSDGNSELPPVQPKRTGEHRGKNLAVPVGRPGSQKVGIGVAGNQIRRSMNPMISKKDANISLRRGDGRIQRTPSVQGVMGEAMDQSPTLRKMSQNNSRVYSTESGQVRQGGAQAGVIKPETIIQRKVIESSPPDMVMSRGTAGVNNLSLGHMENSTSEPLPVSEILQSPMNGKMADEISVQRVEQGQEIRTTAEPAEHKVGGDGYEPVEVVRASVQRASANQADERTAMVFRNETGGDVKGDTPASSSDAVINASAQADGQPVQSESRISEVKAAFVSSVVQAKPMENLTSRLPFAQSKIMGKTDNDQNLSAGHRPPGLGSGLIQKKQQMPSMIRRTQDALLPGVAHIRQPLIRPFLPLIGGHGDQIPRRTTGQVQRKQDKSAWGPSQTESKDGELTAQDKGFPVIAVGYAMEGAAKPGLVPTVQRFVDSSTGFSGSYGQAMVMPMPLGLTQGRVVEKVVQRVENKLSQSEGAPSSRVSSVQIPAMPSTANISAPATTPETMQGSGDIQSLADQVYALIMERLSVERESLGL